MAQRRMFSKSITNSSQFLMMPPSSQNLYFHFGMNADDDGFCEHFTIMRMTESKPDDLKVLQGKGFVKVFDDKVLVIIDWKENNYLRSDRYTPSKYLEIYKEEIKALSNKDTNDGIPDVYQLPTQVRIGKDRKELLEPMAQEDEIRYTSLEEEVKGLKKAPKVNDPELTERRAIIGYFIRRSNEIHKYCPQIALIPALKLVKDLQSYNKSEDLYSLIDWFLESEMYDKLGSDIKICFSLASYNKWMDYKRKH